MTLLSYRIEGQGSPLVLFHGWGVTFPIWQNLAPLLTPYYTLIMPELPGNGKSPLPPAGTNYYQACAQAVENLRVELQIEKWAVLGYSLGAWGAWWYANLYPEQVDRTILVCPAILKSASACGLDLIARLDTTWPAFGNWLLSDWRILRLVQILGFNGRPHPYADLWASNIASQPVQITKLCLYDLLKTRHQAFTLPDLPAVFIWGQQDVLAIAPRRPAERDVLIPGNHSLPMLQAVEEAQAIRAFYPPTA